MKTTRLARRPGMDGNPLRRRTDKIAAWVLLQNGPAPAAVDGVSGYSWVRARWIAPDGRTRTGRIPVSTSLVAGGTVRLWVNATGSPAGPPAWATVGSRGPNASGCGANPDDRTCHHRSAQAYQAADHGNRPAGGFGSGGR